MNHLNEIPPLGNDAWTHEITSVEPCRVFLAEKDKNPYQVWLVNKAGETPADMELFSRALSLDLQQEMPNKVQEKLNLLAGIKGNTFRMAFPPMGESRSMSGLVCAIAHLIQFKGGFLQTVTSDIRSEIAGDVWSVDVLDPHTKHAFKLNVAEPVIDGRKLPSSVWLSGDYPEILDGLCGLLSNDMQKADLSRVAVKFRTLLDIPEVATSHEFSPALSSLGEYIVYLVLKRYVHHFYLDDRANELGHTNVIAFDYRESNVRSLMSVSEMENLY